MTRREVLVAQAGAVVWAAEKPPGCRLAMEAYIWHQYAERQKKTLAEVIGEVIPMAREAGFHCVELSPEFFTPEIREQVVRLMRADHLTMPSVYVGGVMHEGEAARHTIQLALETAGLGRQFGCSAVVTNPSPKPQGQQKSDAELAVQSDGLNRMGRELAAQGFELRVHHHTPELVDHAREWRYTLRTTEAKFVKLCLDLDWAHQGDMDPVAMLQEAGPRVAEVHLRNSKDKLWLEALEDGDVDYRAVAGYLKQARLTPLLIVELAYRENTVVTRSLTEDLRLSRVYAEKVFELG